MEGHSFDLDFALKDKEGGITLDYFFKKRDKKILRYYMNTTSLSIFFLIKMI